MISLKKTHTQQNNLRHEHIHPSVFGLTVQQTIRLAQCQSANLKGVHQTK